ncbi:MAG: TSUP family transporter [Hyphomicrobiales bacterium]
MGFYDGFFGPGTGSFFMVALVSLFGLGVVEATARTKLFNFTSNIAALLMFLFTAKFAWLTGLCMGVAQVAGAQLGAHVAIRNGARIIRPVLVLVCLAMAAKLMLSDGNPLRQLPSLLFPPH